MREREGEGRQREGDKESLCLVRDRWHRERRATEKKRERDVCERNNNANLWN